MFSKPKWYDSINEKAARVGVAKNRSTMMPFNAGIARFLIPWIVRSLGSLKFSFLKRGYIDSKIKISIKAISVIIFFVNSIFFPPKHTLIL